MIDEHGRYDPRDVDDNMMLKFMALIAEGERRGSATGFEGVDSEGGAPTFLPIGFFKDKEKGNSRPYVRVFANIPTPMPKP